MYKESYFDGGLFSYIGHVILATLITVFTLGICAPYCHAAFWKLDQVVAPDHYYLWYLWLLAENQTDPVDYQAYASCELRTGKRDLSGSLFLFFCLAKKSLLMV